MKIKIAFLTTLLLTAALFSCDNEDSTDKSAELALLLNGCWTEIENESFIQFAGTNYTFCFLSDTEFTLELESWTDAISETIPTGQWTDYVKGTYVLSNESLEITGDFMDSNFSTFVNNRFGESKLERTFEIEVASETEMILDKNDMNPTREIRLVK